MREVATIAQLRDSRGYNCNNSLCLSAFYSLF
jgi:hypothetical protein